MRIGCCTSSKRSRERFTFVKVFPLLPRDRLTLNLILNNLEKTTPSLVCIVYQRSSCLCLGSSFRKCCITSTGTLQKNKNMRRHVRKDRSFIWICERMGEYDFYSKAHIHPMSAYSIYCFRSEPACLEWAAFLSCVNAVEPLQNYSLSLLSAPQTVLQFIVSLYCLCAGRCVQGFLKTVYCAEWS